jgi:hypothetical protein
VFATSRLASTVASGGYAQKNRAPVPGIRGSSSLNSPRLVTPRPPDSFMQAPGQVGWDQVGRYRSRGKYWLLGISRRHRRSVFVQSPPNQWCDRRRALIKLRAIRLLRQCRPVGVFLEQGSAANCRRQRTLIEIVELAADRNAVGQPRHLDLRAMQEVGNVMSGTLALHRRA